MAKQANSSVFSRETITRLAEQVLVPTALITAVAYFLGWTASAAYFLALGLSPSFIESSIPGTITAAWLEIILGVICVALGLISYGAMTQILRRNKNLPQPTRKFLLACFFILLALSIICALLYVASNLTYGITLVVLLPLIFGTGLLWFAALVGKHIHENYVQDEVNKTSRTSLIFRAIYPNFLVYLVIVILAVVFALSRISGWRGLYLGTRDLGTNSHLSDVRMFTKNSLPLEGQYDPSKDLYVYDSLKLIGVSNEHIFVVQHTQSATTTSIKAETFVIPFDDKLILEVSR